MFKFFKNTFSFTVNNETKTVLTDIKTYTNKIDPIIYTAGDLKIDSALYSIAVNSDGFLVINNYALPNGVFRIFRNTQLDIGWAIDRASMQYNLLSIIQYLNDLAVTDNTLAIVEQLKLLDKFNFTLKDHFLSFHKFSVDKPVKNPNAYIPPDRTDLDKYKPEIVAEPPRLFFEYMTTYPLPAVRPIPEAGVSEFINSRVLTPIKSLTLENNDITLSLYKNLFDPLIEDPRKAIYRFIDYPTSGKIHINHLTFEADVVLQGIGELVMIFRNLTGLPENQKSNMAVSIENDFIPLKVYHTKRRDFPT